MQLYLRLLTLLGSILPYVLSCGYGSEDYGGDNSKYWQKESRLNTVSKDGEGCYKAHLQNDYHHHDYFFDASICADQSATFNISTPHGRQGRYFKINYNNSNGTQLASVTSRADHTQGCLYIGLVDKNKVDHITVQEWKLQVTNCFMGIFGCVVQDPPKTR